jgi:hypothetical protein
MTEVLQAAMTPPTTNGDAPMPRPAGTKPYGEDGARRESACLM